MGRSENSVLSPVLIIFAAILAAGFVLFGMPAGAKDTASGVFGDDVLMEATFYVA
jgi:homoserine dehydrogenase